MTRMLKRNSSSGMKKTAVVDRRKNKKETRSHRQKGIEDTASESPIQRTVTILEMSRWQHESEENKLEITVGDESDEQSEDEDSLLMPEISSESVDEDEAEEDSITSFKPANDVDAYMARREMTETQERGNALTMIPSPLYCIYYILAGKWLSNAALVQSFTLENFDESSCIQSSWFPNLHAMPPLTVIFVALGISIHAPFSFVYHWKYAPYLAPGIARTDHLSRRLDQAMIHVASAFLAYATSASWEYFFANCFYNADCFRRQFHKEINPRRNQIRIGISMVFYTVPILLRDASLFLECWAIIGVSVWLFVRYPFGGWSHSVFHLVIALLPPLIMEAACQISQDTIHQAAQCAAMRES